jgi:hypothetical protein
MVWLHRAIVCSSFGEGLVRVLRIELSSYRAIVAWLSAQHIVCYCIFIVWSWWRFLITIPILFFSVASGRRWTDFLISFLISRPYHSCVSARSGLAGIHGIHGVRIS